MLDYNPAFVHSWGVAASVGRNAKRHDNEDWHGPKDEHATREAGDARP